MAQFVPTQEIARCEFCGKASQWIARLVTKAESQHQPVCINPAHWVWRRIDKVLPLYYPTPGRVSAPAPNPSWPLSAVKVKRKSSDPDPCTPLAPKLRLKSYSACTDAVAKAVSSHAELERQEEFGVIRREEAITLGQHPVDDGAARHSA